MKNRLNSMAGILILIWAIGFFAFSVNSIINVLLAISAVAVLFSFMHSNEAVE